LPLVAWYALLLAIQGEIDRYARVLINAQLAGVGRAIALQLDIG
jgi:hypothetical protein